jgi:uncharacterized protein
MSEWVLVTGASAGIGRELARIFAEHGFDLVLVARDGQRLHQLAAELQAAHKIQTRVLPQDLAQPGAADHLLKELGDTPLTVLVNNAGFGHYGDFAGVSLDTWTQMMQVNMVALVQLTHLFLQPMRARRAGRILNVASTAAFQPGPKVNIYYASKAFVYSFSYALSQELRGSGISVTTLCPGMTRTEFFNRARLHMRSPWGMMEARAVAECGYRGLMRGRRVVIPGLLNKVLSFLAKRTPPRLTSAIVRRIHQGANDGI